jgi:uncharacterized alpha-E superfamily protein
MLSRVADNLYWMSRYLERAEHTLRLLDVNMGLMLDHSSTSAEGRWVRVLAALGKPTDLEWQGDHIQLVPGSRRVEHGTVATFESSLPPGERAKWSQQWNSD